MSRIPRSLRSANSSTRADGRLRQEEQPVLRRDYNFLRSDILDDDITFSRNSGATQVGSDGYLKFAPHNLLTYSEGAFESNWGNAATATDNTHPNPIDGSLTASTLKSTSGIQHRTISVTLPQADTYIFSVYLKKKTGSASVGIGDFTDGTITQTVTDEWQRFSKTTTFSAGTHTFTIRVGDTDEEVFVWGAQVERRLDGGTTPTDYNKTSGAAYQAPRLDWTKDGDKKGLLIEEARTNFVPYSQDFSHSDWIKTNSTIATSGETDPSGGTGAYKLTLNANDSSARIHDSFNSTAGEHTCSFYVKKGTASDIRVGFNDEGTAGRTMDFNLETGQIIQTSGADNTFVQDCGNGWYRIGVSGNIAASGNDTFYLRGFTTNSNTSSGDYLYIWGAQFEQGSFPTSLIPTYGNSADRAADIVEVTGTNFSRFFKDTEGTFVVDAQVQKGFVDDAISARIFSSTKNETTTDMIQLFYNHSQSYVRGAVSSQNSASLDSATNFPFPTTNDTSGGEISRHAIAYKLNSFAQGFDGDIFTDNTGNVPVGINQLNIGHHVNNGQVLTGWIRRLRYFNKRKSDAQVQKLTDTSFLLDKFKGAKAAHSLRSLRDGRDNSPVTRIRREYDSYEADYTAAQVSNGELENDFKSEKQTTLPLDVSVEADEMIVGGDFTDMVTNGGFDSDSGWAKTNATIGSGVATVTVTGGGYSNIQQSLTYVSGRQYTVCATVNGTAGNVIRFQDNTGNTGGLTSGTTATTLTGSDQKVSFTFTANSNSNVISIARNTSSGDYSFTVDNVSVVEGSWTATNAVISFSDNVLTVDDTANAGTDSGAFQNITTQKGKTYTLSFDKISTTSTFFYHVSNALINGSALSSAVSLGTTAGNFTTTFVATSSTSVLKLISGGTGVTKFDNVSVKEVNPIATGFSTRKINSSYTGKAMRCRNQGNVEVEVGFDDNDEISLSSPVTNTSQNLVPFSEDFTQWTLQAISVESDAVLAPDGVSYADKIIPSSAATTHQISSTNLVSSSLCTMSIFAKPDGGSVDSFVILDGATAGYGSSFDLGAGTVSNIGTATGTITALDNGWYRCSTVFITTGVRIYCPSSAGNATGDGTSGIYFYGAQLEETVYSSTSPATEKVTNGTFTADSDWNFTTGGQTVEITNGGLRIATDGTFASAQQTLQIVAGKKYSITGDISVTSGGGSLAIDSNQFNYTSSQSFSATFIASYTGGAAIQLKRTNTSGANDVIWDNLSVLEFDPIVSEYAQTPVISDDGSNTTAQTLGEFSGKENLLTYSEAFGSLQAVPTTLTGGQADPFGGTDAFEIIGNATHASATVLSGSSTLSIYAKKGTANFLVIRTMNWDAGSTARTWFNLSTGAVGSTDGGAAHTSSSIEAVTGYDGWYRCAVTFNTTSDLTGNAEFYSAETDGGAESSSDSIIAFGMQLNTNSLKDYQKTSGTPLTGDVNVVNWYDQAGGEDFVNATAAYQPRIVMGSELVTDSGGKASVYFDGNDNLINATLAGQNRLDSYIAIEPDLAADDSQVLFSNNDGGLYGMIFDDGSSSQTLSFGYGSPNEFVNGTQLASNATRNDLHDRLNNTSVFSLIGASSSLFSTFQMGWFNSSGSTLNYQGNLSEMVFFPNMDSSLKRFNIEQNMMRHFDVNLVSNGTFDTDSDWIKNTGWSIGSGVASCDGTNGMRIYQNVGVSAGKTYSFSIDVKSITSGSVNLQWYNGSSFITIKSALPLGESAYTFTPTSGTNGHIYIHSTNFVGSVDNVKVQEYGTDGYVTTLYDQTGNNCHATQATAAYQPQLVSGGDLIKSGGHPAWLYNVGNPQRNLIFQGLEGIDHLDAFFVQDVSADTQFMVPSSSSSSYYGFAAHDGSTSTTPTLGYGGNLEVDGTNIGFTDRDDVYDAIAGRKLVYHRDAYTTSWPNVQIGWYTTTDNNGWNIEGLKFSEIIWYDSDQHSNQSGIESNINTHYNIY